jgi:hypothetical protein
LKWNEQLLNTIRRNPKTTGPTVTARAIGILNTAIYDAWAPYDQKAVGTRLLRQYRRPAAEDTLANKNMAISYAAYRVLNDLFNDPASVAAYYQQMSDLGYAPVDTATTDTTTPQGIGNVAAQAVLDSGTATVQPAWWQPQRHPGVPYRHHRVPAGQHLADGDRPVALAAAVRAARAVRDAVHQPERGAKAVHPAMGTGHPVRPRPEHPHAVSWRPCPACGRTPTAATTPPT